MLRALISLIYTHVLRCYKTLFQWEYNGIKDNLLIFILHTPRFPHSAWTLHGMSMEIEWKIEIFYTFSTLRTFHTPHFPPRNEYVYNCVSYVSLIFYNEWYLEILWKLLEPALGESNLKEFKYYECYKSLIVPAVIRLLIHCALENYEHTVLICSAVQLTVNCLLSANHSEVIFSVI